MQGQQTQTTQKLVVAAIVYDMDRVLIYPQDNPHYHVIASVDDGVKIKKGDTIEAKMGGMHFGILVPAAS